MKHTTPIVLAAALLAAGASSALAQSADFPASATVPAADAIQSHLGGNVFRVALADGTSWRLQYTSDGYFFVNTSAGFAGNGTWRTEDGKMCGALRGNPVSCNDVRLHDGVLMLRRNSGEIIRLLPT